MRIFTIIKKRPRTAGLLLIVALLAATYVATGWLSHLSAMGVVAQGSTSSGAATIASQINRAQHELKNDSAADHIDVDSLDTYRGLPVGFTEEGYPFRGDPNAPLMLVEYSDYLCPFCGRHAEQTVPTLLEKYGHTGQVLFVFRDFPIVALHPRAPAGHSAAMCAAEQGAALFWAMHEELFRSQRQWGSLPDPAEFIAGLADEAGVDMDAYATCMAAGEKLAAVETNVMEAEALDFNGTPSFQIVTQSSGDIRTVVGALPVDQFTQLIDSRLNELNLLSADTTTVRTENADSVQEVAVDGSEEDVTAAPGAYTDQTGAEGSAIPSLAPDLRVEDLETYQGVPVGFTEQGYPFRGDPAAPVTFIEYSDYLCPYCGRYFNQTLPVLLEQYAKTGQVLFIFRDLPLISLHPTAPAGHTAALCAGEQGASLFWAMHDELFRTQQQWSGLPDPSEFVAVLAEGVGADMDTYAACMASGAKEAVVNASVAEGRALGFNGTPSFQFVVNGTDDLYDLSGAHPVAEFTRWLDALLLDGKPPEHANAEEPGELPFWASAEGVAPDPERPGLTLAGDQYKGNPEASVVVVEFSDFQCPACRQHALDTQPVLDKEFVDSGEIMWVVKQLPLKEHAQAVVAAVAAECAGEQGQYWQMHHLLFERMAKWATADADAELLALAQELELELDLFSTCYDGRQALQRVLNDIYDAQGSARTTPTFIFLYGGKGYATQGARPADQFATIIEGRLQDAKAAE